METKIIDIAPNTSLNPNKKPETVSSDNEATDKALQLTDFWAYAPENKYLHVPTDKLWPSDSLKKHFDKKAPENVAKARSLQTQTWQPGRQKIMQHTIVRGSGTEQRRGYNAYNAYDPPIIDRGNPSEAGPWVNHVKRIYPESADHIIPWLAHRVRKPQDKVNHAIVLGGKQGIGKDTLLAPVQQSIGPWNFKEVSPVQLLGRFNGFVKSVILRVSEARDMGEKNRYALYEHLKQYTAAPPEFLRCDEKYRQEFPVANVCGVIITTNHKQGGIYLPSDDRRHYVAWSEATKGDFSTTYWNELWHWYHNGGNEDVNAYLQDYDLSNFDPKAPPPKTDAFWEFVDAGRSEEDSQMAACLENLDWPKVVTIDQIKTAAPFEFKDWLNERSNRKQIPYKLENAGYEKLINGNAKDSRFTTTSYGKSVVYGNLNYNKRERLKAVQNL